MKRFEPESAVLSMSTPEAATTGDTTSPGGFLGPLPLGIVTVEGIRRVAGFADVTFGAR